MADNLHTCGLINLDKPSGPTSHDMVSLVRRRLGIRGVGHAGTLDPLATGVLVIGVGSATRLMSFVGEGHKEYIAEILFGVVTDSQDTTGATIRETSARNVTLEALERAGASFTGSLLQIPPMVSALKHNGQRLYQLARQGQVVEREARPVHVYDLSLQRFEPGERATATIRISCSGGFYVRTLCHDLGEALGCGGCMTALRRTAVGSFHIENAIQLDDFLDRGAAVLLPPASAVANLPRFRLDAEQVQKVLHGCAVRGGPPSPANGASAGIVVRLENQRDSLIAMAKLSHRAPADAPIDTRERSDDFWYQPYLVLGHTGSEQNMLECR